MKMPRGRGRPREFNRDEALDRALDLFWKWGYEATSLAQLTAAMGITPPSLYAAFGSKEQLFFEAVDRYSQSATRLMADAPTAKAAIEKLLFELAKSYTESPTRRGCFVITSATNCGEGSERVAAAMRQKRKNAEANILARIERGIVDGELPKDTDASSLSKFVACVVQGMSTQARDGATRKELEAVVRRAIDCWPSK